MKQMITFVFLVIIVTVSLTSCGGERETEKGTLVRGMESRMLSEKESCRLEAVVPGLFRL